MLTGVSVLPSGLTAMLYDAMGRPALEAEPTTFKVVGCGEYGAWAVPYSRRRRRKPTPLSIGSVLWTPHPWSMADYPECRAPQLGIDARGRPAFPRNGEDKAEVYIGYCGDYMVAGGRRGSAATVYGARVAPLWQRPDVEPIGVILDD
jgi:hypothetical protein